MLAQIYAKHLRHFVAQDPERALELASKASDAEIRDRMLVAVGQGWIRADPEAATAWLATAGLSPELEERIRHAPGSRPVRKNNAS
jgi:hypothetical protein